MKASGFRLPFRVFTSEDFVVEIVFPHYYSESAIEKLVRNNPDYTRVNVSSKHLRAGKFVVEFPKVLLTCNPKIFVKIPQSHLVDGVKVGKFGSYQIKKKPKNLLHKIPLLGTLSSSYTQIDLVAT